MKEEKEVQEPRPPRRAAGTCSAFAGHRLEGTIHQVPHQRRRTHRQD